MTVLSGKQVIFSAPCSDGAYSPSGDTPMMVEVSKVTIIPRPISLEELEVAKDIIDNSIETMNSVIDVAKALIEDKAIEGALDLIAGLGDIMKGVLKLIPKPENPLIKNLDILEQKVKKLEDLVMENLNEMRAFISEVKFFVKVISPTSVLIKHMRDCIKNPGDDAIKNFAKAYQKHPPLQLAYTLISYLEQKSTNPLKLAMENEKIKTKATFMKWEDIITRAFSQFILLQAFANGLLKSEKERKLNCALLIEEAKHVVECMHAYKEEIGVSWEDVQKILKRYAYLPSSMITSDRIANLLKKELDDILTGDSYYIIVTDSCNRLTNFAYICSNEKTQVAEYFSDKGNLLVYRSRHSYKKSKDDYKKIEHEVESCRQDKFNCDPTNMEKVIKEQLVDKMVISDHGFICMINQEYKPEIRFVNCPDHERGPGWWTTVDVKNQTTSSVSKFCLTASFE